MSDLKLFQQRGGALCELQSSQAPLERALQTLFEQNLEALLGVRFLASEYVTSHKGRMDTLGIDENGYPVIIEYKRDRSENVINQGLFYLDWLMDHRGDFEILVRDRCGVEIAQQIEWSAPRLICIAADFNKYDEHAVKQMGRSITLIRYKRFSDDLLLLEQLTDVEVPTNKAKKQNGAQPLATEIYQPEDPVALLYNNVEHFLSGLGDDVSVKELKTYRAFKRIKNFACIPKTGRQDVVRIYLRLDPDSVELSEQYIRDVRGIGKHGTGDVELTLWPEEDWEWAKPLIFQSYEAS